MRRRSGRGPSGSAGRCADAYRLTGTKIWISNAPEADRYLVFATVDPAAGAKGITAFLVEKGTPGFRFGAHERKMGIRACPAAELVFEGCEVPAANRLGAEGEGYRIALSALARAGSRSPRRASGWPGPGWRPRPRYLGERQAFGGPLSDQQGLRFMLAEMARDVAAARALTREAAAAKDRGEPLAEVSSLAKWTASDTAMRVATDAVQLFGGERLLARDRHRAPDARRQGRPDLRGHEPDPPRDRGGRGPQAGRGPGQPMSGLGRVLPERDLGARGFAHQDVRPGPARR